MQDLSPRRSSASPSDRELEALADDLGIPAGVDRRRFLTLAASVAVATGLGPSALAGSMRTGGVGGRGAVDVRAAGAARLQEAVQEALGNGEPPAFTFQAWPGGTGDLMQRMFEEYGAAMFDRTDGRIGSGRKK